MEPSRFSNVERPPVFPVCLVVDVSVSMRGKPIDAVNRALPELRQAILDDPSTGEIARLALVTFSARAGIALPLRSLGTADIPQLGSDSSTNFAAGLQVAREALVTGIKGLGQGTRFYRPVVFFLSDGAHNHREDWRPVRRQLIDRDDKYGAEIVAFGMGDANRQVIAEVSTGHAFFANDTDPASAVREILKSILGSIKTTSRSFDSPAGPQLFVPPTEGLTRLPQNMV